MPVRARKFHEPNSGASSHYGSLSRLTPASPKGCSTGEASKSCKKILHGGADLKLAYGTKDLKCEKFGRALIGTEIAGIRIISTNGVKSFVGQFGNSVR